MRGQGGLSKLARGCDYHFILEREKFRSSGGVMCIQLGVSCVCWIEKRKLCPSGWGKLFIHCKADRVISYHGLKGVGCWDMGHGDKGVRRGVILSNLDIALD